MNTDRFTLRFQRRALRWSAALLLFAATGGWAQNISDVPMAVKNNVPPNLMFMIDNSGSMFAIVPEAPYDPNVNYRPGDCGNANAVAAGSTVTIRVIDGAPRFRVGDDTTNYRHWSISGDNRRCFFRNSSYDAALLTGGAAGAYATYTGNFLNWYFGTGGAQNHPVTGWTDRKRLSDAAITAGHTVSRRVDVARRATKAVIDTLPTSITGTTQPAVRVGLTTYTSVANGGINGGELMLPMRNLVASNNANTSTTIGRTTFKNLIDDARLNPFHWTPLAATLADIGRYFATPYSGNVTLPDGSAVNIDTLLRQDGTDSPTGGRNSCLLAGGNRTHCANAASTPPVTLWCQRNYALMVTDGLPTVDRVFNNNARLRDFDGDCQGPLASTCVNNGAAGSWDRKLGRSYHPFASDYFDDVAKALFDVDLRPDLPAPPGRSKQGFLRTYVIGFADPPLRDNPLLHNTARQGGGLFVAADDESELVDAFRRVLNDAFARDAAAAAVAVANAQIALNNVAYASSYNSGGWYGDLVAYSIDTTTAAQVGDDIWSLREHLNAVPHNDRRIVTRSGGAGRPFRTGQGIAGLTNDQLNFIRGDRSNEGSTLRQRSNVLGDIINAEPVLVTYPGDVPVIFQGANDGMLHVVDARTADTVPTRGQVLWSYVPGLLLPSLAELTSPSYTHRYYVDATPAVALVNGGSQRLLVGGLGKGGRGFYALDVTSYAATSEADAAAKVRWEFSDGANSTRMGFSFGTPLIVNTASGWRVLVTSGYANGDGKGYVWVLDLNGNVVSNGLITLPDDTGTAASPTGLAHLSRMAHTAPDAVVRYVYGGDLKGNIWRFDLDALGDSDRRAVRIAALTDALGNPQPVTAPLEVGPVPGSSTKIYVYAGTGRYLADEDVPGVGGANVWSTQRQSIYGIIDDTTRGHLALSTDLPTRGGSTCASGGGAAGLVCQTFSHVSARNTYAATTHAVDTATRRGWYADLPADERLNNGRITGRPALTPGGTLAFTANVPSNTACEPGGSSWFFAINAINGGAVATVIGGEVYNDVGFFLGFALASRPVIVETAQGRRALIRMSDKSVQNPQIPEAQAPAAQWRRVYWRAVR